MGIEIWVGGAMGCHFGVNERDSLQQMGRGQRLGKEGSARTCFFSTARQQRFTLRQALLFPEG